MCCEPGHLVLFQPDKMKSGIPSIGHSISSRRALIDSYQSRSRAKRKHTSWPLSGDGNPQARLPDSAANRVRTEYKRSMLSGTSCTRLRTSGLIATFPRASVRTIFVMDRCERCSLQAIKAKGVNERTAIRRHQDCSTPTKTSSPVWPGPCMPCTGRDVRVDHLGHRWAGTGRN